MTSVVLDASITLAWCFPDEQGPLALRVLERLRGGERALVPAFWSVEILNCLLVGEKRGRISSAQTLSLLDDLAALRPVMDFATVEQINGPIHALCRNHNLTPYDALYVELALRTKCPLATLDERQQKAAKALSVECL